MEELTRRDILESAIKIIRASGEKQLSIDRVGAGIAKGSVYLYYKNRQAFIKSVIDFRFFHGTKRRKIWVVFLPTRPKSGMLPRARSRPFQFTSNSARPSAVSLDEALTRLHERHPVQCRIVEMRYFGGLTLKEIAELIGIGKRSVDREWSYAKAWLYRELADGDA